MKAVNDFIQKNSKKSEAEKKKILVVSMVIAGIVVLFVGMVDISNNLSSIYGDENGQNKKSSLAAIRDKFAEILGNAKENMQVLNDRLEQK